MYILAFGKTTFKIRPALSTGSALTAANRARKRKRGKNDMMHPKLHHIALKVRNLERCEQFYAGVLNLPLIQRHRQEDGAIRSVWFDLEGVTLMLERCEKVTENDKTAPASQAAPGWHLLALTIAPGSRAQWREKLRRAGVRITGETVYSMYFSDPENNRLALSHYPECNPGSEERTEQPALHG